jgi:hypothetical protein
MSTKTKLIDLVSVRGRYQKSAHLERDTTSEGALAGYIVTPLVRSVMDRLCASLELNSAQRAWSVTGPYGTGKTAMAVLWANLISDSRDGRADRARRLLAKTSTSLAERIEELVPTGGGFVPVLATGERNGLDVVLLGALSDAVEKFWRGRGAKPAILGRIEMALQRRERGKHLPVREVVSLFEETATKVRSSAIHGHGLLVILDEAGKCLEYASQQPATGDVQLLQELAESANRSGDAPIVFITILHQAIERYASRLGAAQRSEWAKVQGRFEDIAFQEDVDQLLKLVASALECDKALPSNAVREFQKLADEVASIVAAGDTRREQSLRADLRQAFPLHPVTALILGPLFRTRLAQNERSLFSFLCSGEPLGFRAHLDATFVAKTPLSALYTPDQLYDYVLSALGPQLYGTDGRQWAEVDTALRRLPRDAEGLEARLLKTIGMLSIVGETIGARASVSLLALALSDEVGASSDAIRAGLESLVRGSVIVYRRYRDAYQIWEGSDLDVDQLIRAAHDQTDTRAGLPSRLSALVPPRPVVARRHLFQTGTLRYFEVRYVDAEQLEVEMQRSPDQQADGLLLIALPRNGSDTDRIREVVRQKLLWLAGMARHVPPVVIGVPRNASHLLDLTADLAALEWVHSNTAELARDSVARREVLSRLSEAERLVSQEVSRLMDGGPQSGCEWFHQAERLQVRSSADLSRRISEICDTVYEYAPIVQNELINRRNLSSAAAAARRNLLEAMLLRGDQARLGFEGYPPEVSIYRSVLESLGLHRKVKGALMISSPGSESSARYAWIAITDFLNATEEQRQSVADLYRVLAAPPFGVKEGLAAILVWAALIHLEPEIAVFEQGAFIPGLSAPIMERMLRQPDKFELQRFKIAGVRAQVFEHFGRALLAASDSDNPTLLGIVKSLVRFIAELPDYARITRRVSARAQEVRNALVRAKEPAPLLFRELPIACGCAPFEAKGKRMEEEVERFFATLRGALGELQNAYASILEDIRNLLTDAFELGGGDAQHLLSSRARRLVDLAGEPELKAFLMRAADATLKQEEWLVSVSTYLANKPPSRWNDTDFESLQAKLSRLVPRFRAVEALAIQRSQAGGGQQSLMHLSITRPHYPELERVIAIAEAQQPLVASLSEAIREAILSVFDRMERQPAERQLTLAALAEAVQQLLEARPLQSERVSEAN